MPSLAFITSGRNQRDAVDRIGIHGGVSDLERCSFQDALRGAFAALDIDTNGLHDAELSVSVVSRTGRFALEIDY